MSSEPSPATDPAVIASSPLPGAAAEIRVVVNGEPQQVPAGLPVTDLLVRLGLAGRPLAVEINRTVVPRRLLAERLLAAGDQLEIVTLVGGG